MAMIVEKSLDDLHEERTPDGKFLHKAGPGRSSKKLMVLKDRYRTESADETLTLLAADVEKLESELAAAADALEVAEAEFLESVAPAVKHREEIAMFLARARVSREYLSNPITFTGSGELPSDRALREFREIATELQAAERELPSHPEPKYARAEAIFDDTKWQELHLYERYRDLCDELRGKEHRARKAAEGFGHILPVIGGFTVVEQDERPRSSRSSRSDW